MSGIGYFFSNDSARLSSSSTAKLRKRINASVASGLPSLFNFTAFLRCFFVSSENITGSFPGLKVVTVKVSTRANYSTNPGGESKKLKDGKEK